LPQAESTRAKASSMPASGNGGGDRNAQCRLLRELDAWLSYDLPRTFSASLCAGAIADSGSDGWPCDFWARIRTSTSTPRSPNLRAGIGSISKLCRASSSPSSATSTRRSSKRSAIWPGLRNESFVMTRSPVVMIHGAFCGGWAFEGWRAATSLAVSRCIRPPCGIMSPRAAAQICSARRACATMRRISQTSSTRSRPRPFSSGTLLARCSPRCWRRSSRSGPSCFWRRRHPGACCRRRHSSFFPHRRFISMDLLEQTSRAPPLDCRGEHA